MNTKIDKSNMFQSIWDFPENIIDAVKLSESILLNDIYDDVNKIIIAGMGGSGSLGDVISAILSKKDIHVSNIKGYSLPKTVESNSLFIATSVTGNTD